MLKDPEKLSLLEEAKYLYLRDIREPRDNSLRIVVEEAIVDYAKSHLPEGDMLQALGDGGIPDNAHLIETNDTCRTFVLFWKHYAAYLITEECVGSSGTYTDEAYTGKLLRRYSKSHFLDHLARDTGGHSRPLQHHKLVCLNHLIDVASEDPPAIEILNSPAQDSVQ